MFKIASLIDLFYKDGHQETISTCLEKTFPTIKAAEYYAHRRAKSNKYKEAFRKMRIVKEAIGMREFNIVVDEEENPVNDSHWIHEEGLVEQL